MTHSQNGQDLAVVEIFKGARDLHFIEIGAGNGVDLSNTLLLEQEYGWRGLLIEANPLLYQATLINRPEASSVNALLWHSAGKVLKFWLREGWMSRIVEEPSVRNPPEPRRIHQRYKRAKVNGEVIELETDTLWNVLDQYYVTMGERVPIDFMSIDVEGSEDAVLFGFPYVDHVYTPRCLCIERPSRKLQKQLCETGNYQSWGVLGEDTIFIHKESGLL